MKENLIKICKFVSKVLRHDPLAAGISLDQNGWANVSELINGAQARGKTLNEAILREIVDTNEKKRFCFDESGLRIRANQGHSISVDVELSVKEPPEYLYHGTATRFAERILEEGIKKMGRQHVHLSQDEQTANKVGSRHGKPIVLVVHAKQMCADGYTFFLSKNGVWLTDNVSVQYIKRDIL